MKYGFVLVAKLMNDSSRERTKAALIMGPYILDQNTHYCKALRLRLCFTRQSLYFIVYNNLVLKNLNVMIILSQALK